MNDYEKQLIDKSIAAYEKMIDHFKEQIEILSNKKNKKCCFPEKIKHRIPIKDK